MARKHVIQYFLEVQNQYFESLETIGELDVAAKKGLIEQDRLDSELKEIQTIKQNYERIAYIIMLLNKPNRKSKEAREETMNRKWYDYLKGSGKEAILNENRDALADLKKFLEETEKNGN